MTTHLAKRIVKQELSNWKVVYTRLSAQTVSFSDLARASRIFVKVHGVAAQYPEAWKYIDAVAKQHGFSVEVSLGYIS